jgi:hypothetical protein
VKVSPFLDKSTYRKQIFDLLGSMLTKFADDPDGDFYGPAAHQVEIILNLWALEHPPVRPATCGSWIGDGPAPAALALSLVRNGYLTRVEVSRRRTLLGGRRFSWKYYRSPIDERGFSEELVR